MKNTWMGRIIATAALAAVIAVVPGCSGGVDGDYSDAGGNFNIGLHGGKATVKFMGESKEGDYKVDGDKVTITPKGEQPLTLTHDSEGLHNEIMKLTKK